MPAATLGRRRFSEGGSHCVVPTQVAAYRRRARPYAIGPFGLMPAATYSPTHRPPSERGGPMKGAKAAHGKLCNASQAAGAYGRRARPYAIGPFWINAGSDLLSHTVSHAVPSAVSGLTSVFGMG